MDFDVRKEFADIIARNICYSDKLLYNMIENYYVNNSDIGVYFIELENYTKIGMTSNLKQRLKHFKVSSPKDFKVKIFIGCKNNIAAKKLEKDLHKYFDHYRYKGEWFDILDFKIDKIKNILKYLDEKEH